MKVIYESIFDEIAEAVEKSRIMNRPISCIIVTENEWDSVENELRTRHETFRMIYDHDLKRNANEFYLFGVKIIKESGAVTEGEVLK